MAVMFFYDRAVALSRERHQKLKIQLKADHFSVAAKTNSVLLAAGEFAEASRDYPIVFVGQEGGAFTAAALVGLSDQENLLVAADGNWEAGTYIPAFIRRYPFVLAGADDSASLTVCVDEAYAGLTDVQGEALFNADGSESEYLKGVIEFLRLFHSEMLRTGVFAKKLADLGLLESKVVTVKSGESTRTLDGLWVVSEAKLAALDDSQILELVRSGYMGWIYAHLLSLGNVARLAKRLDVKQAVAAAPSVLAEGKTGVVH